MNRTAIAGIIAVLALVVLGVMTGIRSGSDGSAVSADSTVIAGDLNADLLLEPRTKGSPSAPITIYDVSDFQCPFCRDFWKETLPALEREYIQPGKVRLIFINFPITATHKNALAAHELAMCAAEQNRFWRVHDLLYEHQMAWAGLADPGAFFRSLADSAGLDRAALQNCYSAGKARTLVRAEAEVSTRAGIRSTPSFIVQGAVLTGHAPIKNWRPILDSIYVLSGRR